MREGIWGEGLLQWKAKEGGGIVVVGHTSFAHHHTRVNTKIVDCLATSTRARQQERKTAYCSRFEQPPEGSHGKRQE